MTPGTRREENVACIHPIVNFKLCAAVALGRRKAAWPRNLSEAKLAPSTADRWRSWPNTTPAACGNPRETRKQVNPSVPRRRVEASGASEAASQHRAHLLAFSWLRQNLLSPLSHKAIKHCQLVGWKLLEGQETREGLWPPLISGSHF